MLAWLVFSPKFYATPDEHNYYRTAWDISHNISPKKTDQFQALGDFPSKGFYVSKYNLGNSIWLIPGAIFNLNLTFFESLFAYLLIIILCYYIIKEYKLPKFWLLLIILFPPLIYFSRTILSEVPAAVFFTLSYWCLLKYKKNNVIKLLLGASLGFLTLIRYNFGIWAILILLQLLIDYHKNKTPFRIVIKEILIIFIGALPFLAFFFFINSSLYGGIITSGYRLSGEEVVNFSLLISRLPAYLILLNIVYPGQLIIGYFSKQAYSKLFFMFIAYLILVYSVAGGFLFQGKYTDIISGVRFFIPILPIAIIHYASVLNSFTRKIDFTILKKLIAVFTIILLGFLILLNYQHYQFIKEKINIFNTLQLYKTSAAIFVGDQEDFNYFGEELVTSNYPYNSGFININDYKSLISDNNSMKILTGHSIYFLEISYNSRSDRPTSELKSYVDSLISNHKVKLISTTNPLIYQYEKL